MGFISHLPVDKEYNMGLDNRHKHLNMTELEFDVFALAVWKNTMIYKADGDKERIKEINKMAEQQAIKLERKYESK